MSEDVFLGLGVKTPGSSSCTHMTVKVTFPGHSMKVHCCDSATLGKRQNREDLGRVFMFWILYFTHLSTPPFSHVL